MKPSKLWSRRSLMQTLTVGGAGLSFMGAWNREVNGLSLLGQDVRAALTGPPKRLIVFFSKHGIREGAPWENWCAGGTAKDWSLGPVTKPLEKHKDDLVFFDNLTFGAGNNWTDAHWTAIRSALTAALMVDPKTRQRSDEYSWLKTMPDGPSIDQYLAEKLGKIATPQWPSLVLNARGGTFSFASIDKNGQVVSAFDNPYTVYDRLFSSIPDQGKASTPDPNALKRALLRGSVLDGVAKEVEAFKKRLPVEDRTRADAQLDAIRTFEQRLGNGGERPAPGASCKKPAVPATRLDPKAAATYPQLLNATSDAVVAALACDLTRVVMFGCDITQTDGPVGFAPFNSTHSEHDLSHDYRADFESVRSWYMGQVAYLLDRLKSIPEGEGTMLDNTIVLFATEISRGHGHERMPFFTAGGKNLGVDVGKFLKLPIIHQNPFDKRSDKGYPHGRLFVSILNALGLADKTFGIPSINTGPMDGYLKG